MLDSTIFFLGYMLNVFYRELIAHSWQSHTARGLQGLPPLSLTKTHLLKGQGGKDPVAWSCRHLVLLYTVWGLLSPVLLPPQFLSQVLMANEHFPLRIHSKHLLLKNSTWGKYLLCIRLDPRCWGISKDYVDTKSFPHGVSILMGFLGTPWPTW